MQWRRLVVLAALAACGDNAAAPPDAAPPPYPDAPPYVDQGPTIDYEEGPEPNGFGVIEASGAPAGVLPELKPITVLHGHLVPFRDIDSNGALDPDVDTFTIQVLAPALVQISVQGAGFELRNPDGSFVRFGDGTDPMTGYVPLRDAGAYWLSIADVSLFAGGPTVATTAEYYAFLVSQPLPANL